LFDDAATQMRSFLAFDKIKSFAMQRFVILRDHACAPTQPAPNYAIPALLAAAGAF
jgi:hypothetical protein